MPTPNHQCQPDESNDTARSLGGGDPDRFKERLGKLVEHKPVEPE